MKPDPESLGMELTSHQLTALIVTLRGDPVILDSQLAEMYEVETKTLNRAVKRNADRFPERFCFQLNAEEWDRLKYQFGTSSEAHGGRRHLPYAFTEQGVAMLSAVLRSAVAVRMSLRIIDAFVAMRRLMQHQGHWSQRLGTLELKQAEAG